MSSKTKVNKNFGSFFNIISLFLFSFFVIINIFDFELTKIYSFFISLLLLSMSVYVYTKSSSGQIKLDYIKSSIVELKKVVWPDKEDIIRTTAIVLLIIALMSVLLKFFDILLAYLVKIIVTKI